MSELQASHFDDQERSRARADTRTERVLGSTNEVAWLRTDWEHPVGFLSELHTTTCVSVIRGERMRWAMVAIPELWLTQKAALLLLQGMALSKILIPNHGLLAPGDPVRHQVAHLLLRVDPWQYWQSAPSLTGLVLARLGAVPPGVGPSEVLGALVHDSAHS